MHSFGLSSTLFSVCPDCGSLNFISLNQCSNCGCPLVGSGVSPNNNFLPPSFTSQNFPYFNCTNSYSSHDHTKNQRFLVKSIQSSLPLLEQAASSSRKFAPRISMRDASYSLDVSRDHLFLVPYAPTLANKSEEIVSYPLQLVAGIQPVSYRKLPQHYRNRSTSGTCSSVPNFNQSSQHQPWANSFTCRLFYSNPHVCETVQLNCPYLFNVSPKFVLPYQGVSAQSVYCHNAQTASQSISQLSEMLMGRSAVSQTFSVPLEQQSNCILVNRQPYDTIYFNKRRVQNQRQACGFRNKGLNKRNARNHADRAVNRCFRQPLQMESVPVGRRWKSRQCSLGSITQTATVSSPSNALRMAMQHESMVPDFSDPSSANISSSDDLMSCEKDNTSNLKWLRLPTELWHNIVRLLPYADRASLARTCRKFRTIVADSYNWRIIRLDRYQHLTDSGLAMIGRKKPRQLHFTYCRGDAVTNWGIDQLFKGCGESLESFSFIGCSKGAFQGDYPLLVSTSRCPNLCHIDASYAHTVRDRTVRAIAEGSVALKTLLLNGAQHISNSAIEHLVRHHKHTLERLELFGCFHLNSKIFTTLGECHGLRALAFGFLHHLSSNGLLELVSKLPLLASLDLRGTQKLVTDTILSRLAKECPLLEEVVLANMSSLTREEGVITMLHQLPRLRVLDLCGLAVVGDNSLRALATSCPLLEELDISCTSVTEVGLLYLANAPANSLKLLRIGFCPRITADAIEKLVGSCPKLTHLSLYGFSWIKKWNFLFDLRPNLVIQTETQCIKPGAK